MVARVELEISYKRNNHIAPRVILRNLLLASQKSMEPFVKIKYKKRERLLQKDTCFH
jgi:hypothetical protein